MPIRGTNNRYDVYDNGDSVTMIRNDNTEDSPFNPNMIEFQKPTESTTSPGTYDGVSEYRHNLLVNNLTDTNLDQYTPSGNPARPTGAPGEASRPSSGSSITGGFSFSGTRPSYTSPYQDQIDALLSQIQNRPDFSYNYVEDPTYEIYRDQYTREGNLAMRDAIGNSAALSGGYGNSYGTTAGSQAYQAYLGQLNAIVPELEQLAYQRYQDEGTDLYNQLSALSALENAAYGQYRDQVGDYYNDYQLAYQEYSDALAQENYRNEFDYQRGQDNLAYSQWLQEFEQAQQEAARDLAYRYAAAGMVYPYDDAAQSVQYLSGGTGGSTGGSRGSGNGSRDDEPDTSDRNTGNGALSETDQEMFARLDRTIAEVQPHITDKRLLADQVKQLLDTNDASDDVAKLLISKYNLDSYFVDGVSSSVANSFTSAGNALLQAMNQLR